MNVVEPIRNAQKVRDLEEYFAERNKRDWLLFVAGTNTGLRISDLLQLRAEDVRDERLAVKEKKTRKRKLMRINPKLQRAFREYAADLADREYLFRSRKGFNQPISRRRAYEIIKEAARRHGLKHIGTHSLRKTFGYHFYQQTKDVALLQRIFNHSDPAVTLRYIGINQDLEDSALARFSINP